MIGEDSLIGITDPDPIVIVPIIDDCTKNCGANLPGLDWLWWTLGTLGTIGAVILAVILVCNYLFRY